MKTKIILILLPLVVLLTPFVSLQAQQQDNGSEFTEWVKEYITEQYPGVEVIDNVDWYQAVITDLDLTVSWAFLPQTKLALKEVAGIREEKSLFIYKTDDSWADVPFAFYTENVGYYISGYASTTMGNFEVAKLSVLQYDGESKSFSGKMIQAWIEHQKWDTANQPVVNTGPRFVTWLKNYISTTYPKGTITDHGGWVQAHLSGLVVNWAEWNEDNVTLKYLEGHALSNGKNIFIEKKNKQNWPENSTTKFYDDAGYFVAGYHSETMADWSVQGNTVIQFDGNPKDFIEKMSKSWANAQ